MRSSAKLISVVIGVFTLFLAAAVLADDFSADMINTTNQGVFRGKIFISQDKTRMETPGNISIMRMDRKVAWILMPQDKMYMEQPLTLSSAMATSEKISGEIERKLIGQEMIDGRMTSKYQIVYNQRGKRETMFQWLAAGLKVPVKTAAADGSWTIEYKNIQTGKQPDSLFEIPAGYQKFSYQMPNAKDVLEGLVK